MNNELINSNLLNKRLSKFISNNFKIYNTLDSIYIQNTQSDTVLEINKAKKHYQIVFNTIFTNILILDLIQAHCILGIINIYGFEYIIYSSQSELTGRIDNEHEIFMIKQADAFLINDCKFEDIPNEVRKEISGICELLGLGFFYSFTYDLSNSYQRQEVAKQKLSQDLVKNKARVELYFEDHFNFNMDYNTINTSGDSKLKKLVDFFYLDNIQKYSRKKFYWNYSINNIFYELNKKYYDLEYSSIDINSTVSKRYLKDFNVVVICGFFNQTIIEKKISKNDKVLMDLSLISRRSVNHAGTRYNTRGIDKDGYVANFVETEQIFTFHNSTFSYVQLRGSAPVFFQQIGLGNKTEILQNSDEKYSKSSFLKHMNECLEGSKYQLLINLLDNNLDKEKEIIKTFEGSIQICTDESKNSSSPNPIQNTKYIYYNFNNECKKDEYSNIEKTLLVNLEKIFQIFGFFCIVKPDRIIKSLQSGVIRTNCLDSLDRTNVIQTLVAYQILKLQLNTLNVSLDQMTAISNVSTKSFFRDESENDAILQTFKNFWTDNGDMISLQYTGTESCKSSITKKGKSEFFEKFKVGLDRFIQNNFEDDFKQKCFNNLLQIFVKKHSLTNVNLFEDKFLNPIYLKDSNSDSTLDYVVTDISDLTIYIATWNSAGIEIFRDSQFNIEDLLYPKKSKIKNPLPDIYCICFQEIVELNTANILFKSNSTTVDGWKSMIQDSLNNISKKYGDKESNDEYVLIKTLELVGILMVILVKRKYFSSIKNIDYSITKTGVGGLTGNKGSVFYRFELFNKSFAFVSGHYAAGQSALKNRIEELTTVMNFNFGQTNQNISYKGKVIEHDYWYIIGDLNFRIDMENDVVRSLIKKDDFSRLMYYDQLNKTRTEDKQFSCLTEGQIKFPPTYKYEIGTMEYATKKNRVPSWCDRILYKKCDIIELLEYNSIQDISFSDHKPVYGFFKVELKKEKFKDINNKRNTALIPTNHLIDFAKKQNKYISTSTHSSDIELSLFSNIPDVQPKKEPFTNRGGKDPVININSIDEDPNEDGDNFNFHHPNSKSFSKKKITNINDDYNFNYFGQEKPIVQTNKPNINSNLFAPSSHIRSKSKGNQIANILDLESEPSTIEKPKSPPKKQTTDILYDIFK